MLMDYTLKNYENVNYVMCMFPQWKKKKELQHKASY